MLKRGGLLSPGFRAVNAKFSVSNLWSISQAERRRFKSTCRSSSMLSQSKILLTGRFLGLSNELRCGKNGGWFWWIVSLK